MEKVALYIDPEIELIKQEIKNLEIEIEQVNDEIVECQKLIHDFGIQHSLELGDILGELLKIKKEKLESEQNGTEANRKEFEQAQQDYEQYYKQYKDDISENQFELTDDEKLELKRKYRKASKLCHPDLVTDQFKEYAELIFKDLQQAYEKNDLNKITEILEMLEKGEIFIKKSDGINELDKLRFELLNLQNKLFKFKEQLNEIKNSESYNTIIEIEDWAEYFRITKENLLYELESLHK